MSYLQKLAFIIGGVLFGIANSFAMDQQKSEVISASADFQSLTNLLPADLWRQIAHHLPANDRCLNRVLSRLIEMDQATYNRIIRALFYEIEHFPGIGEIDSILHKYFRTFKGINTEGIRQKVMNALQRYIRYNPLNTINLTNLREFVLTVNAAMMNDNLFRNGTSRQNPTAKNMAMVYDHGIALMDDYLANMNVITRLALTQFDRLQHIKPRKILPLTIVTSVFFVTIFAHLTYTVMCFQALKNASLPIGIVTIIKLMCTCVNPFGPEFDYLFLGMGHESVNSYKNGILLWRIFVFGLCVFFLGHEDTHFGVRRARFLKNINNFISQPAVNLIEKCRYIVALKKHQVDWIAARNKICRMYT